MSIDTEASNETETELFPDVSQMSSSDRTETILALRRKRAGGTELTDEEVTFAVRLLRAERTIVAKKRSKTADDPGPILELSDF